MHRWRHHWRHRGMGGTGFSIVSYRSIAVLVQSLYLTTISSLYFPGCSSRPRRVKATQATAGYHLLAVSCWPSQRKVVHTAVLWIRKRRHGTTTPKMQFSFRAHCDRKTRRSVHLAKHMAKWLEFRPEIWLVGCVVPC